MIRYFKLLLLAAMFTLPLQSGAQPGIGAILADDARPQEDRDGDAARKPLEILEFFGVGAGDSVADLLAGGGYWTRILVPLVGSEGRVYAGNNPFYRDFFGECKTPFF
jgi:predicted methyltransferase